MSDLVFNGLPKLTHHDRYILKHIIDASPEMFYSNKTYFFISEIDRYVSESRVWRNSIMGETRSGKTEVGLTEGFIYTKFYNKYYRKGLFKNVILDDSNIIKGEIKFEVYHVRGDPMDYQYTLRNTFKEGKLTLGQIWIIDESKKSIGGLGSMSENIEMENINDICAKFIQSEIWITPRRFETRNAPYGLYVYTKDMVNRVNWCLLYKIQASAKIGSMYTFLGWVCMPLHTNKQFRIDYEKQKNVRIGETLEGSSTTRLNMRLDIARRLSVDKVFSAKTGTGKQFVLSISEQFAYIDRFLKKNNLQDFNQAEKYSIVSDARSIIKERFIDGE